MNKAREASEQLIDQLWQPTPGKKKPRTYRQQVRQNYLRLARNKRPGYRLIRKTIRKQLSCLLRNLNSIETLALDTPLSTEQLERLQTLKTIYEQQQGMYDKRQHKTEKWIVSVHQPWVRPIVRGKQTANTEFDAKIAISVENGYSRVEKFSFETELVLETIKAAQNKWHLPAGVIWHNDRGSQYTAQTVMNQIAGYGWKQSFSRVGKPGDNAWSESFFSILKKEIIPWHLYPTRDEARQRIFEYIEVFYNRQRAQRRLGYLSPVQYLKQWQQKHLPAVA